MAALRDLASADAVDILLTPAEVLPCRLLIADMDSTIVTSETLDELANYAGVGEKIAEITKRTMNGELDFKEALRERVGMLRGLSLGAVGKTLAATELMGGARELVQTMRAKGAYTALVSGGFTLFTGEIAARCGFDRHMSNELLHDGAALTGQVGEPILDKDSKLAALHAISAEFGFDPMRTLAVGDGANDLPMLKAAGLGIGFHAKPVVAAQVGNNVRFGDLRALLFAQGIFASEIVAE